MRFPDIETILETNQYVVDRSGEAHNVLFPGNLEQAVLRARRAYQREGAAAPTVGAILFVALVQGHPFQAGNKRTGWLVLREFLRENGCELEASADEAEDLCKEVAARSDVGHCDVAPWIRDRLSNA